MTPTGLNTTITVVTNASGVASASLVDTVAETVTVTAKAQINTADIGQHKAVSFTANPLTAVVYSLIASAPSAPATGSDGIILTAVLRDMKGNVVTNALVEFTASRGNLSASQVTTDSNGVARVTLTSIVACRQVKVTAKSVVNSQDIGQIVDVSFTVLTITGVSVNSFAFPANVGFPSTGFIGAAFTININGAPAPSSSYTWSDNSALVSVSNTGTVTFTDNFPPGSPAVTITATPTGGGAPLNYTFQVRNWFISNGATVMNHSDALNWCSARGYSMPASDAVTNSTGIGFSGARAANGLLWSEWGNTQAYPGFGPNSGLNNYWNSNADFSSAQNYVTWMSNGYLSTEDGTTNQYVVCSQPL